MDNVDKFVNELYDELLSLYKKDKNVNKKLLGSEPINRVIDNYVDWIVKNMGQSPKITANDIYHDLKNIRYTNFNARQLRGDVSSKKHKNFNLIYGNIKQIDDAIILMDQLKNTDPDKHALVTTALEKIKELSDYIKPEKNIFGKTTNIAKKNIETFKQPNNNTFMGLLKYNTKELTEYIRQINAIIEKKKSG